MPSRVPLSVCLVRGDFGSSLRCISEQSSCHPVGNLEMVGRLRFFVESYRLCVPKLKSMGWQCAILGQLVGTTKIQDGCRDPGKLRNVFIFILRHARNIICIMYSHVSRYEEFNGTVYNNVRLCSHDQNSKWPPFSPILAKIEHNLIAFCYINMILFCPFLCFTISGLNREYCN